MNEQLSELVKDILQESSNARMAFDAMRRRGLSSEQAEAEIGTVLVGCILEQSEGRPNRWKEVLKSLQEGGTAAELFPEAFTTTTSVPIADEAMVTAIVQGLVADEKDGAP